MSRSELSLLNFSRRRSRPRRVCWFKSKTALTRSCLGTVGWSLTFTEGAGSGKPSGPNVSGHNAIRSPAGTISEWVGSGICSGSNVPNRGGAASSPLRMAISAFGSRRSVSWFGSAAGRDLWVAVMSGGMSVATQGSITRAVRRCWTASINGIYLSSQDARGVT